MFQVSENSFPSSWEDNGMDWDAPNPLDINYWYALKAALMERSFVHGEGNGILYPNSRFAVGLIHSFDDIFKLIYDFNQIVLYGAGRYEGLWRKFIPKLYIDNYEHYFNNIHISSRVGNGINFHDVNGLSYLLQDANTLETPLLNDCTIDDISAWMKKAKKLLDKMVLTDMHNFNTTCYLMMYFKHETSKQNGYDFLISSLNNMQPSLGTYWTNKGCWFIGFYFSNFKNDNEGNTSKDLVINQNLSRIEHKFVDSKTPQCNAVVFQTNSVSYYAYSDFPIICEVIPSLLGVTDKYGVHTDFFRRDGDKFIFNTGISLQRSEFYGGEGRTVYGYGMFPYLNWDCEGGFKFRPSTANDH